MSLKWYGEALIEKVRENAADAINDVMDKGVRLARQNHPGWKSVSGAAEDSIHVVQKATEERTVGIWGSTGCEYFLKLEFRHGRALERAADSVYKDLPAEIRKRYKFSRPAIERGTAKWRVLKHGRFL